MTTSTQRKQVFTVSYDILIIQHLKPPKITVQFVGEKHSQILTYIYTHALLKCRDSSTRLSSLSYLRSK